VRSPFVHVLIQMLLTITLTRLSTLAPVHPVLSGQTGLRNIGHTMSLPEGRIRFQPVTLARLQELAPSRPAGHYSHVQLYHDNPDRPLDCTVYYVYHGREGGHPDLGSSSWSEDFECAAADLRVKLDF